MASHIIKLRTEEYLLEAHGDTSTEARDQFNDAVTASAMPHIQRRDPPIADFSGSPTIIAADSGSVAFTDASSGQITTWAWDFGDGETSTLQNPSHTFTVDTPGVTQRFSVTLTVSGPGGTAFERKERYIRLN